MPKADTKPIAVVFWGTAPFAVPLLRALSHDDRFEIVAVVTKPDEPVGRNQVPTPSPVKAAAEELRLRVLQPASLKDERWYEEYAGLQPDLAVVVAYGKIIPERLLDVPAHKTLNVHPSLLPKYRGPSPIQAAIANGDAETGISVMLLDREMDHGAILTQETVALLGNETSPMLEKTLADAAAHALPVTISLFAAGGITPRPQNHDLATFTKIIAREDGRVDWTKPAVAVERLHRAYQPWPGIWTEWKRAGRAMRLKLLSVAIEQSVSASPGTVLADFIVACGNGGLRILKIQPEGKKEMSAEEFLRGHPGIVGSVLR